MKRDLDRLMAERKLDGFLVMGEGHGPVMKYLTSGGFFEGALLLKPRGEEVTLVHGMMERDTAAATGLRTVNREEHFNGYELLKEFKGDRLAANAAYLARAMEMMGLRGRVGVYGLQDAGATMALMSKVQEMIEEIEVVGEYGETLFSQAFVTKDDAELEILKRAGRLTCAVVGEVQAFIQEHAVGRDETVLKAGGDPLTIGDVKAFMRGRLHAKGLAEDHGTIFSQGRDAGVPHNSGDPSMPLQLGRSIIFDIYPTTEEGYFHDMTRTWSLGYASDEVQAAYDQTKEIFDRVMSELALGRPTREYQLMVCDFYEAQGHRTVRSHPGTEEGYVHSLGHGIGLEIHEGPRFSHAQGEDTLLQPGHVVTIEPGLYYPTRGYGVRVEDAVAFNEAGELIWLTDYPYDLVVPMRG
ncbi:MAG: M24 family metallopeptidase [Caldilineaceae bacterium]|nr:M24 family metallopeptidase [Caldilineaceae bacterium]